MDTDKLKMKIAAMKLAVLGLKISRLTIDKTYPKDRDPKNWRTINGSKVHLTEGKIDGGAGGRFNGKAWAGKQKHEFVSKPKDDASKKKIDDMIQKYHLQAVMHNGQMCVFTRVSLNASEIREIKANKDKILAAIKAKKDAEAKRVATRQAKIDAIPGLKEIKAAREAHALWQARLTASIERGASGKGVGPEPKYDFEAAYKKYPQAHAYLVAEHEANKHNYEMAAAGKKALEKVINGQWKEAMKELEDSKAANRNELLWD